MIIKWRKVGSGTGHGSGAAGQLVKIRKNWIKRARGCGHAAGAGGYR